jgi:DHA1 family bicyclomycin/chloramphenicol resistance-like MFS transporter
MSRFLLVLLASLTALAPLAIDAYLPAMPEMATGFGVSIHAIELSLSVFLAGFASGQLIGGPLSDYAGRRPTIFTGLVLFIIGTSLVIVASSVELLWAGRFIQAIGGGLAVVNSSAVIRDLSEGKTAARHMGNMMLIMLMAPLLAPMIGSALLHLNGWMLIFEFLLVYAIVIIGCLYVFLPETRKTHTLHLSPYQRYKSVLTNRLALSYIGSQCFAVAAMFASITASPTVFMEFFGISAAIFPLFFAMNVISIIGFNRLNIHLLKQHDPKWILKRGQVAQLLMGLLMLGYLVIANDLNIYLFTMLLMTFVGLNGLIVSNATALNVHLFPHSAATATAISGAFGFASGFVSSAAVGLFGDGSPWPMALVMSACSVLAIIMRTLLQPK